MALNPTDLKNAIDSLVIKGDLLITLRAAPTVTTLGAAKTALQASRDAVDLVNSELGSFLADVEGQGATNI